MNYFRRLFNRYNLYVLIIENQEQEHTSYTNISNFEKQGYKGRIRERHEKKHFKDIALRADKIGSGERAGDIARHQGSVGI